MLTIIDPIVADPAGLKRQGRQDSEIYSFIISGKSAAYRWEGSASLSIKCFFDGRALYSIGRGHCLVDDDSYLVVNDRQPYSLNTLGTVECFCLFFEPGLIEDALANQVLQHSRLLDAGTSVTGPSIEFCERTHHHDRTLSPILFAIRDRLARGSAEPNWLI